MFDGYNYKENVILAANARDKRIMNVRELVCIVQVRELAPTRQSKLCKGLRCLWFQDIIIINKNIIIGVITREKEAEGMSACVSLSPKNVARM